MSEPAHPVRLVVTDDLHRSRLTVFFRLILVIPHFLWLALWAVVAFFVAIAMWFATLFRGTPPEGIHRFLCGYVRYATHVNAYLFLGANPYPKFLLGDSLPPYPVDLEFDPPARQSRWSVLFRIFLALPAFLISSALTGGGAGGANSQYGFSAGIATSASFFVWFVALFLGRAPRGLRDLIVWGIGYTAQTYAYLFILTGRYPYSGPDLHLATVEPPALDGRPHVVVSDDLRRSRLLVFFRLPLAFPHLVWLLLWTAAALIAALVNWLCALAIGRSPRPFARFLSAYVRYLTHVNAFFWLVADPFPGFVGKPRTYPVDLELDPFARQRRLVTLFRLVLMLPAVLIASGAWGILTTIGFLGWFAALVRGRMPQGMRNAGAFAAGYIAQVTAYELVLVERYPMASPIGTWRAA